MSVKFDIGRHVLVPKHEIFPEEKVRDILERYKIAPHQLPLIKSSDPVARSLGAKPGDILRITRESQTKGKAISYRYVIEG